MTEKRLLNASDYFENITKPAYDEFMRTEVTFLVAFSLAMGLYHICEWVWHHDEAKVTAKFGPHVKSAGDLWSIVEGQVTDAGLIRDMNNAAKHVVLTFDPAKPKKRDPSTTMYHAANTSISTSSFGTGPYGAGAWGGTPEMTLDEGGRQVPLEPLATSVFKFWETLVGDFYPAPTITVSTVTGTSSITVPPGTISST